MLDMANTPLAYAVFAPLNLWGETFQLSNQIPAVPFKPADLEYIMIPPVTDRKDE